MMSYVLVIQTSDWYGSPEHDTFLKVQNGNIRSKWGTQWHFKNFGQMEQVKKDMSRGIGLENREAFPKQKKCKISFEGRRQEHGKWWSSECHCQAKALAFLLIQVIKKSFGDFLKETVMKSWKQLFREVALIAWSMTDAKCRSQSWEHNLNHLLLGLPFVGVMKI